MFEDQNRPTRRGRAFLLAAALHAAALGALLIPWTRHEPIVFTIESPFRYEAPSAPAQGSGGATAKATPVVKRTANPTATPDFVEPTPVDDDTLLAQNDPGPLGPGPLDGDPDSDCVGPDCTGVEPTSCQGPHCTGFVSLPRTIVPIALHAPQPAYPAVARLQGRQGVVVVEILVGIDGKVSAARLVEGAAPFDAAALAAVRGWRYQPVFVDGQAIAWKSTITLKFQLK